MPCQDRHYQYDQEGTQFVLTMFHQMEQCGTDPQVMILTPRVEE